LGKAEAGAGSLTVFSSELAIVLAGCVSSPRYKKAVADFSDRWRLSLLGAYSSKSSLRINSRGETYMARFTSDRAAIKFHIVMVEAAVKLLCEVRRRGQAIVANDRDHFFRGFGLRFQ
jgi:hypothetical protein